jgi:hypothetical protein
VSFMFDLSLTFGEIENGWSMKKNSAYIEIFLS